MEIPLNDLCALDAVTLAAAVRSKQLSPVEVVEAVLLRMERLEPQLHAFCTATPELARATARAQEAAIMAGRDPGPLAGVPIGIKDLVMTRGIRTTSGSRLYADFVPDQDDVVVERLCAAGAILLGKTNTAEFGYYGTGANRLFPTTCNPWDPERTSGGSSAGSAAAVAAGMGPLAVASDGGGSVRIPAALCGLYGLKASMGRVPLHPGARDERYPGVSSWESLEHIGPVSRTVADAALMMSVMAGPDARDRHSLPAADVDWLAACAGDLRGLRVAYSADFGYAKVDAEVREICARAAQVFERDLGCTVEEVDPGWADPFAHFFTLIVIETDLRGMRRLIAERGDEMMPAVVEALSRRLDDETVSDALMARKAVANCAWRLFRDYDLLLTPTTACAAFAHGQLGPTTLAGAPAGPFDWLPFTYPFNLTGQPAASLPAGFTREGLPVGLQIVGRHLDDTRVLRASAAFEAAAPWRQHWPKLVKLLREG